MQINNELEKIKQKALEEHIPIIMDDTLEVVDKILTEIKPTRILEIGTAVGYSAICFSEYLQTACKSSFWLLLIASIKVLVLSLLSMALNSANRFSKVSESSAH